MKQYLKKLKTKMPAAPGEGEEDDDMLAMDLEEGESPEHEAAESPEFEAGEHEEAEELGAEGLPEGTPEEEAVETEEQHTAELSDEALLAEVKKRGLLGKKPTAKAVAVPPPSDEESDKGY